MPPKVVATQEERRWGKKGYPVVAGRAGSVGIQARNKSSEWQREGSGPSLRKEVQLSLSKECWTHLIHKETEAQKLGLSLV